MAQFENAPLGLAFNGTVDHSQGLLNSSGNVTIPPEVFQQEESHVTFDVKVFDVDENGTIAEKPAIEKTGALEVVLNGAEPPDTSTHTRGEKYYLHIHVILLSKCWYHSLVLYIQEHPQQQIHQSHQV